MKKRFYKKNLSVPDEKTFLQEILPMPDEKAFLQERLLSVADENAFLCLDPKDFYKHVFVLTNEHTVRRQNMGTLWSVSINSKLFTVYIFIIQR